MGDPVEDLLAAKLRRQLLTRRTFMRGAGGLGGLALLGGVSAFLAACNQAASSASIAPASVAPTAAAASAAAATAAASAKLGGALNFIGYDGEDAKDVAKSFFQQNNIKMNPTFIADAFEPLTKFNTGGRGQLDIISDNKDFQRAILAAGVELFQPLDLSRIPNAAGLFPAFQQAPWLTKDGQMYGIPLIWGDEPCIYNPKKWDGVPAKYTDFAAAKYKGELVLVDDPIANTWLFAQSLGMPQPNRLTQAQLDQTMTAMKAIKPNVVTFSATLGDQADVLIRGDASMGIGGWAYQVVLAQQKGVTLVTASPATDGTYYWSDAYAIAVGAPNVDNAYAFMNFMMAPENNSAIAIGLGSGATIAKAVDQMDAATKALYHYDLVAQPGGILATQVVSPPQNDDGDVVGVAKWQKAWQDYKLA
jgi:spermidine/putrescine-binding protein